MIPCGTSHAQRLRPAPRQACCQFTHTAQTALARRAIHVPSVRSVSGRAYLAGERNGVTEPGPPSLCCRYRVSALVGAGRTSVGETDVLRLQVLTNPLGSTLPA